MDKRLTSQNSRNACRHMPHGLAGGLMSVATARALKSPLQRKLHGVSVHILIEGMGLLRTRSLFDPLDLQNRNKTSDSPSRTTDNSSPQRNPLCTCTNGIRGILHVRAYDVLA